MHARQQLPCTTGTHEVGEAVVGAGELIAGREAYEDHGQGIDAFGLVDGGVADGVARRLVEGFEIGPQGMTEQVIKTSEWRVADLAAVMMGKAIMPQRVGQSQGYGRIFDRC